MRSDPRSHSRYHADLPVALRTLWPMLLGQRQVGTHAERLSQFYGPQADSYDAFRERLLPGRATMIERLPIARDARVTELGAGTGRTAEFFGERLSMLASLTLVDLCTPLLNVARRRFAALDAERAAATAEQRPALQLIEADITTFRPAQPQNIVYFSFALTMVPDWRAAIDNALAMLAPGGVIGVVDFHLPTGNRLRERFWRRWFAHDGVHLSHEHLPYLRSRTTALDILQGETALPFLPFTRVPYYHYIGRRNSVEAAAQLS